MITKKIPVKKLFAIQAKVGTGTREYWEWLLENWWDSEGQLYTTSSMKKAAYRKRKLEKQNYGKGPGFPREFRIVRIRFKRDVLHEVYEEKYMAQVYTYLKQKGLKREFDLWRHGVGIDNGLEK